MKVITTYGYVVDCECLGFGIGGLVYAKYFWRRQIRQVRQRQMEVPHAFQAKISLDTHQKGGRLYRGEIRVNIWGRTLEYAWLLWLTTS